jgi:hypothetical protein
MRIEVGTGLMLRKIGVALVAAMLVAAPALAIETQPPAASPIAKPTKVSTSKKTALPAKSNATGKTSKAIGKTSKVIGKTVGTHQQRPAKISTTTGVKAREVVATKKSNQNATALPAKSKSKIAKFKIAKSKIAKNTKSKNGISNSAKSSQVKSQQVKNRTPADVTGSVAPRSVPTPGLY